MNGFALNVTTDLSYFDRIIPCGIFERGVTSLQEVLGSAPPMKTVESAVAGAFAEVFGTTLMKEFSPNRTINVDLSKTELITAYRNVVAARLIDAKILVLLKQGKVFFHIGVSGHEVAQTAAGMALQPGVDWAYPYYRDLAFALQLGYSIEEILLEALHRKGGPSSNGFSMPFHYGHLTHRIVAQSSPTGTQYLQAVGTAMGAVREGRREVVYVSSGEGATSEGEFHEALNWAAREKLPRDFLHPEQ